jgi:dihydrofolate synthase/folylpolyglutamate synthase
MRYPPSVEARVNAVARTAGAPVSPEGRNWFWAADDGRLTYRDAAGKVQTPLPVLAGPHQPGNLALAIAMLHHQKTLTIPPDAFVAAAEHATWPARMQLLGDGPLTRLLPSGSEIWLDGGHNAAAGASVAAALREVLDHRETDGAHMIVGMLSNKDPAGLLQPFAGLAASFHAVPVGGHECHSAEVLGAVARDIGMAPQSADTVEAALQAIADDARKPVTVMILGSLYLAGEVLAANGEAPE